MLFETMLGETIPKGLKVNVRHAVRALIFRDNRLLMVKTNRGDYKFPGGGIQEGESVEAALAREVEEETGYGGCLVKRLLGTVCEQSRDCFEEHAWFCTTSFYYLCELPEEKQGAQRLDEYEAEQEFQAEFVTARQAADHNEALQRSGCPYNDWVERETYVLQEILEGMVHIYCVRHAQPIHGWKDDRTRPLTEEGKADSRLVTEALKEIPFDAAVSSPYLRSMDTIRECAKWHGLEIQTDERFRERESGSGHHTREEIARRWADFTWHEDGGESLEMVQERNVEAFQEMLSWQTGRNVLFGTHGTALSVIINYYDHSYGCDDFFRMVDYMPYVVRMDFLDGEAVGREELLIVEKPLRFAP